MQLSVIIPTHKRPATLRACLEHLAKQTIVEELEVIVVNDEQGSLGNWELGSLGMHVRIEEVAPCQQGVARNHGVQLASAPLTLFIGDDIFLAPDACEKHLSAHAKSKIQNPKSKNRDMESGVWSLESHSAVLGFTTWDPGVGITPVMRWLEKSGWQFGYPKIAQYAHATLPKEIQHQFTYTSNISLPTEVARAHPFRSDVALYGWEDITWGIELRDAGIDLYYEPDAKALHHHRISEEESLERVKTLGTSAKHIAKADPDFDRLPHGFKRLAYHGAALLPTRAGRHRRAFLEGIKDKS